MQKVTREETGPLSARLTVHIGKSDYVSLFEDKLREFRKKAQLKGFRKGHTPEALVRKMYGESILADVVQSEINQRLQDYLKEAQPVFFGEPMLAEDQEGLRFNLDDLGDYRVHFDLGLIPEFALEGFEASQKVVLPRVKVPDADVDRQIGILQRRHGERTDLEDGVIEDMDYVELHLEEWEDGQKKAGGVHTHTHFLVNEQMSDTLREEMIGKKKGDTFRFDPYKAEKTADDAATRKYILHLEEDAPETSRDFLARVDKITRVTPAPLDQVFYDKAFGPGQVSGEADMRELVRQQMAQSFAPPIREYAEVLMKVEMLELNAMPLPEDFLRKWVVQRAQDDGEKEMWDEEKYRRFFTDLRWSLVRDKMLDLSDIEVQDEELLEAYKVKLREYFGGQADEQMLDQLAPRALTDKEFRGKLADEIVRHKLTGAWLARVTLKEEEMSPDAFRDWMNRAYEDVERRYKAL